MLVGSKSCIINPNFDKLCQLRLKNHHVYKMGPNSILMSSGIFNEPPSTAFPAPCSNKTIPDTSKVS